MHSERILNKQLKHKSEGFASVSIIDYNNLTHTHDCCINVTFVVQTDDTMTSVVQSDDTMTSVVQSDDTMTSVVQSDDSMTVSLGLTSVVEQPPHVHGALPLFLLELLAGLQQPLVGHVEGDSRALLVYAHTHTHTFRWLS